MIICRGEVGIPEAVDATGAVFGVDRITPRTELPPYQRPLRCPGCGVDLDPVNGYLTNHGTAVSAHFRLVKHHHHSLGCSFDFVAECVRLQRHHPEILTLVDGLYQLDLEALLASTGAPASVVRTAAGPTRGRDHGRPRDGRPVVADIIHLLQRFNRDSRAQEAFTAIYGDEQMSWHMFCFDAASEVKRFQRILRTEGASVPRMLVGVASAIHPSKSGDTYAADIEVRGDHSVGRPVLSDRRRPILPVVRASSRDEMTFASGDRVAAFGLWHLFGALEQPTLWLGNNGSVIAI